MESIYVPFSAFDWNHSIQIDKETSIINEDYLLQFESK